MIWSVLLRAVMITSFVGAMMILVEYVNVLTQGQVRTAFSGSRWSQYLAATALGLVPGCLGAFVVVALFIHRSVTLGAVVACMIATSGDEAFVMLALFPAKATLLMLALAVIGILAGLATDLVLGWSATATRCDSLEMHLPTRDCRCFDPTTIVRQLRQPSVARGLMITATALFALSVSTGFVGPFDWGWMRITLLCVVLFALFVVTTVPEHFLEEHLWRHIALRHLSRIFLWTFAAMLVIAQLDRWASVGTLVQERTGQLLLSAAALGVIPESGPHLLFVTLFDQGVLPWSVLITSSIVQDGHGMLPLLSHSWRDFLKIKAINVLVGLLVGGVLIALGR